MTIGEPYFKLIDNLLQNMLKKHVEKMNFIKLRPAFKNITQTT